MAVTRYKVRLVGREAELGEVEAADVARLILGVERAVARAAGASIGKPVKPTGRWGRVVEDASSFRLRDVSKGSVVLDLELPDLPADDDRLDIHVASLGDRAWDLALRAIEDQEHADFDLLRALADLADKLHIGSKYDAIELHRAGDRDPARLDSERRSQLREAVRRQILLLDAGVSGTLVEADFERNTAHVRTLRGDLIDVIFDKDQADEIQEALRQQSAFEGEVTVDPITNSVKTVRLRQLVRTEQLILGEEEAGAFWRAPTFAELRARQGTAPVRSFDDLHDDSLSDEEFEEFFAALEQ